MSGSMFQQNDRRLMSISIVHNDNSPMFQQISVVPSVCVDFFHAGLVYSFMMWETFDESLFARLRGVPTISGFGARFRTFSFGRPFHRPRLTMH